MSRMRARIAIVSTAVALTVTQLQGNPTVNFGGTRGAELGTTAAPATSPSAHASAPTVGAALVNSIRSAAAREDLVLDLADIVGGGDGTGTGGNQGIDQTTGAVATEQTEWLNQPNNETAYLPVPALLFVDGVFTPDGGAGAVHLNSSGDSYTGLTDTTRSSWDYLWNGINTLGSSVLDGVDYATAGHSLIGFHVNKGVTFDLSAIETANPGRNVTRFTAMVGLDDTADPAVGSADFWVFEDAVLKDSASGITAADGATALDIPLSDSARFLTLIATDGGDQIDFDSMVFGDPRLTLSSTTELPDANFVGVDVIPNPDTLVAFNLRRAAEARPDFPLTATVGNYVRGMVLESLTSGWYVTSSNYVGGLVGIWRLEDGYSSQIGVLPFDTTSFVGMSYSHLKDHLWCAIDPDETFVPGEDPFQDGPEPLTLYRIDFNGDFTEQVPLWIPGDDDVSINGLAMDFSTGVLYGVDTESDALMIINPATGECAAVGTGLGFDGHGIGGLDFTMDGSTLVLVTNANPFIGSEVRIVDRVTGLAGEVVALLPFAASSIAAVGQEPPTPGDFDEDQDADLDDYAILADCITGPAWHEGTPAECDIVDLDHDDDVDLHDIAGFQRALTD